MTEPTDAELKALWQLHAADIGGIFHYARAVLAKWGSPVVAGEPDFYTACAWHEGGGVGGWIALPGYSNETEHGVKHLVLEAARKEGYKGTAAGRLLELGWVIRPVYLAPQPTHAQADGFFLLLPQRPKPEAPAGTVGLDWDAYSGAQMLAFGRDCSDAAIAALRTEQPAPAPQQAGERVYAFRRKGLADFCTCGEARYEELSNKPHLFETRIFYTAPQPVEREPLTEVQINAAGKKMAECMDYPWGHMPEQGRAEMRKHAQAVIEAAHGIKGGQHVS